MGHMSIWKLSPGLSLKIQRPKDKWGFNKIIDVTVIFMRSCLICSSDGTNVHRRLRGLFVYQEKSLTKHLRNFEVLIRSLGNKLHISRNIYSAFYMTKNNRSEERSGYWQVDSYCYVYIYSWATIINLFWAILLSDLLILIEPSNFYDRLIVIYLLDKSLHTDFVATRKSAVHR